MAKHYSSKPEPSQVPASVNPRLKKRKRKRYTTSEFLAQIQAQNRSVLSQAMTLVESKRTEDRQQARQIVEGCLPLSGQSFRLGITGVPGVGKSTFIETLGLELIKKGHKLAVLTIDPSSQMSKGSILGDKTRMQELSSHPQAFIRPSPAGDALGGVAAKTRELILLCEAAGFDFIIIETVGVGQSEVAVHSLSDFFLLLLLPGGGDELQGIKRGVVEMADLIAVNKADGDRELAAKKARAAYQRALHLFPAKASGWVAKAQSCSALNNTGVDQIIEQIQAYHRLTVANNYFETHRKEQAQHWFRQSLQERLLAQFYENESFAQHLAQMKTAVEKGELSPQAAVELLLAKV